MRDRVEMLGGRIQIQSPAAMGKRGTRIEVDFPSQEEPIEPARV